MSKYKEYFNQKELKRKPYSFSPIREKLHEIIFEAETTAGKIFDIALLIMILLSIITLMLETVPAYYKNYKTVFLTLEWIFTIFFTVEYFLRIYCVYRPRFYIFSFYGLVDLLSILPSYLTLVIPGMHSLMIVRGLRLTRVFRIFKLDAFIEQGNLILNALNDSRRKLTIFAMTIIIMVSIFGSLMYLIENGINPQFDSIPRSIYWCIVTITTVGYGDMAPNTPFGQFLASIIMLMGYIIIAVPTGIVTSSIIKESKMYPNTITCKNCSKEGHANEAKYCDKCGFEL
ncbi:MAG: ion transporter [Saprospiraceae bacterium]|nr:ion transporter [Saprospiraceae bacterium]